MLTLKRHQRLAIKWTIKLLTPIMYVWVLIEHNRAERRKQRRKERGVRWT